MTEIVGREGANPEIAAYFALLRALKTGIAEGWFHYRAGDHRLGTYVVELAGGRRRRLDRDAFWWILGAADFHGHGDMLLVPRKAPDLYTVEEAADVLGLSTASIQARVNRGDLYPVYPIGGGPKLLVVAEVLASNGSGTAAAWRRLRTQWPPSTPVKQLSAELEATPTEPFSVSSTPLTDLRIQVLEAAERAGLLRYLWVDPPSDTYAASITVDKVTTTRQLYGPHVLPWTRGVADQAGRPDILEGLV